jgi:ligand-binding sensor domain-containing protein
LKKSISAAIFITVLVSYSAIAQWTALNSAFGSEALAMKKNGATIIVATKDSGIFISTNAGGNWEKRNNGLSNKKVYSLAVNGSTIAAGTYGGGIFFSTDNGMNWTAKNSGVTLPYIYALAFSGSNILAGSGGAGVYISTNSGDNWNINLSLSSIAAAFHVTDTTVYLGIGPYFYRSRNNGADWSLVATANYSVKGFAITRNASTTNLFVGTLGGMYVSTNNGGSWSTKNSGLTYTNVNAMAVSGNNLFAATENGGVFVLKENATSWEQINTGLPANTSARDIIVDGSTVYLATAAGVVWKRSLSEVTSVQNYTAMPERFSLSQNFPNPFNPETKIRFQLKENGWTTLKIYDLVGREVTSLIDQQLSAGTYEVTFNARAISSGVYLYRLQTKEHSESRRMIVLR